MFQYSTNIIQEIGSITKSRDIKDRAIMQLFTLHILNILLIYIIYVDSMYT